VRLLRETELPGMDGDHQSFWPKVQRVSGVANPSRRRLRNTGVENGVKLDSPTLAHLLRWRLRNASVEDGNWAALMPGIPDAVRTLLAPRNYSGLWVNKSTP